MIEQQRQHQQFDGRADRLKPGAPGGVRPQGSDQRQRNHRDRQREIGRSSDRNNARGSMVGINATNQSTTAIATPEVDQGNRIAIRTVSRSILKIRAAGSCRADQINESQEAPGSLLAATVILVPWSLSRLPGS